MDTVPELRDACLSALKLLSGSNPARPGHMEGACGRTLWRCVLPA